MKSVGRESANEGKFVRLNEISPRSDRGHGTIGGTDDLVEGDLPPVNKVHSNVASAMPLQPSRFQWNEAGRWLQTETDPGNFAELPVPHRYECQFLLGIDRDRDDEIAGRVEMDRLRLLADAHAIDLGSLHTFDPQQTHGVALRKLVKTGRAFRAFLEGLRHKDKSSVSGDVEGSWRTVEWKLASGQESPSRTAMR